jgi:hypothetical protein
MIEFDKETYGAEWLPKEKRNFFMCSGVHFVWFLFNVRCPKPQRLLRRRALRQAAIAAAAFALTRRISMPRSCFGCRTSMARRTSRARCFGSARR